VIVYVLVTFVLVVGLWVVYAVVGTLRYVPLLLFVVDLILRVLFHLFGSRCSLTDVLPLVGFGSVLLLI